MISIREYQDKDKTGVIQLWARDEPNPSPWNDPEMALSKKQSFQPGLLFVAEREGKIIGTTMAGYDGHRGWIYSVVVDLEYRRMGLASKLIALAEQKLINLGCVKLNLQVRDGNEGAVKLYESLGYSVEPRVSMGKRVGG